MNTRPKSVTIISWYLIIVGGISMISTPVMLHNETTKELMAKSMLPFSVQYAMQAAGVLVMIGCGLSMLGGKSWARTTYVAWTVFALVVTYVTSPFKAMMIPGALFLLVATYFLYRPAANAFFAGAAPPHGELSV